MGMALHPDGSTFAGQYMDGARHGVGIYARNSGDEVIPTPGHEQGYVQFPTVYARNSGDETVRHGVGI
ncbi:hypothetical protein T484DRAFT_1832533 [Baffinella frigidus]|nr:hypothetical protein T484DRAFT_1832533 [Cryptophyta sp. CCMP2293]